MMDEIKKKYGGRLRVRVCGILIENEKILLIKHTGLGKAGFLWAPPGGEVEFQEPAEEALVREFEEETHLHIEVNNFLFVNEYMNDHFHAIELFFEVKRKDNKQPQLGIDPELTKSGQQLSDLSFFSMQDLSLLEGDSLHNALKKLKNGQKPLDLRGFYKFVDISDK